MLKKIKNTTARVLGYKKKDSTLARIFELFIETLVLLNVGAVILQSNEKLYSVYHVPLDDFEIFTVSLFSIEFILRLWTSDIAYPEKTRWQSYKKYLRSTNAIIDFIAILPFFIPFIIRIDLRHLRIFRLVRLMRVFKLSKYSHSIRLIGQIIVEKKHELLATLLLMFSMLIFASTIMFYTEKQAQPNAFPNILYAFWWGIITLTTVGYGDVYPITGLGKLLGGFVAILGILIVAIPTGIISSSFVQKMEESNYFKRIEIIKNKLREAFYKKFIPELNCYIRRGQLSVDAVKLHLELSENDVYKIAEGKNEFRFRNKKVIQNGLLKDKLFLEYREINRSYGTFKNRKHRITLVSADSNVKQSIGYFVYCISEKLKCNYISNEFFGDDSTSSEESFGDSGLDPTTIFSFSHNKAYFEESEEYVPLDFEQWKNDLILLKQNHSIYFVFNTFEQESSKNSFINFSFLNTKKNIEVNNSNELDKIEKFKKSLLKKAQEKFGQALGLSDHKIDENNQDDNILLFINKTIESDVIFISISEEFIINEKLFSAAALVSSAIQEEVL